MARKRQRLRSNKNFRKTAKRTNPKNLPRMVMRGGIRL